MPRRTITLYPVITFNTNTLLVTRTLVEHSRSFEHFVVRLFDRQCYDSREHDVTEFPENSGSVWEFKRIVHE